MARRKKKLNKPLVITLLSVFVVLLGLGALGGWKYRSKLFPKDPDKYEALGDQAKQQGDLALAEHNYFISADNSEGTEAARRFYKLAKLQYDWSQDQDADLTVSGRLQRYRSARTFLDKTVRLDPTHAEALRLLCEINWSISRGTRQWEIYTETGEKLFELDDQDHLTCFRVGWGYANMARTDYIHADKAEEYLRRAVELKPDEYGYWIELARFYGMVRKDDQKVQETYEEALNTSPNSAVLHVNYAEFLRLQLRKGELAEQHVRTAIEVEPDNVIGHLTLAKYLIDAKKPDEAIQALQIAKKVDNTQVAIYGLLATAYGDKELPEQAVSELREGLDAIARKNAEETTATQPAQQRFFERQRMSLLLALGETLLDMVGRDEQKRDQLISEAGDIRDQIALLTEEVEQETLLPEQRRRLGRIASISGRIAYFEGDAHRARELLEEAYEYLKTTHPKTATALIRVYMGMELYGLAEKIVDAYLDTQGFRDNSLLLAYKGQFEMERRNFEQARRYVTMALMVDPENKQILNIKDQLDIQGGLDYAKGLWLNDQYDQAIMQVEQIYQDHRENLSVVRQLAYMYLSVEPRQVEKARLVMQQALKRYPDDELLQRQQQLIGESPEKQFELWVERARQIEDPLQRALEMISACRIAGKDDLLLKHLKEAAQIAPTDRRVARAMMDYALWKRDWKLAREWIEQAKQSNLDGVGGRLYVGRLAHARREFSTAAAELEELLKERPELKVAQALLGDCYVNMGDLRKAEEAFRTLATNDPSYPAGLIGMARVTELMGKTPEHAEWVQRAFRLVPTHPYIKNAYLGLEEEKADPGKTILKRERIVQEDPGNMPNRLRLAGLYERVGRIGQAEEMYVSVANNISDPVLGAQLLCDFYARTGRLADAAGTYSELIKSTRTTERKVAAWTGYAKFLAKNYSDNPDRARKAFERAIKEDPQNPRPYLEIAKFLGTQGKWAEATDYLKQHNTLLGDNPIAEKQLIRFMVRAGDPEAVTRLDRILSEDPMDPEALTVKAAMMIDEGDLDAAEDFLNRAIRSNPKYYEALFMRSGLYLRRAQPLLAEQDLRRQWEEVGSAESGMQLAALYVAIGEAERAEEIYLDVLTRYENYQRALNGLIQLYFNQRAWDKVEKQLAHARQAFPRDPMYVLLEGRMHWRRDDKLKAVASYARAAELNRSARLNPGSPMALQVYWTSLADTAQYEKLLSVSEGYGDRPDYAVWVKPIRAMALAKTQKYSEADELFVSALKLANTERDLLFVLNQLGEGFGKQAGRDKWRQWIAQHRPNDAIPLLVLGMDYVADKSYLDAETEMVKALKLAKDQAEKTTINRQLGMAYYRNGKFKQAEQTYLAVLEVVPSDITSLNNLAYMYVADMDEPDKALESAERAMSVAPSNPSLLDTYGLTLAKLGRYEEAERYLRMAVRIQDIPANLCHLGWVCEMTGRISDARDLYEQALKRAKDSKEASVQRQAEEALQRIATR